MATRGRKPSNVQLNPGQSHYVLQRLIGDRRVSAGEVSRYVADMGREIDELEQRLRSLREASAATARGGARRRPGRPPAATAAPAAGGRRRRRRGPVSAERRASQQLQGRYLGLIRQVPASKRARYTKVAKEKGREAAIKEMTAALGR